MALPATIAGVRIALGPSRLRLPDAPLQLISPNGSFLIEADRSRAVVWAPGAGRFTVCDGTHVTADIEHPVRAAAWLQGTVVALLMAQQGRFALHASTVEVDGRAVALTGRRGAGKSTTALRLHQGGNRLLADDVAPMAVVGDRVMHEPTGRPVHLWPDAAERLGIGIADATRAHPDFDKVTLPLDSAPAIAARAVVWMESAAVDEPSVTPVVGADAAAVLSVNAYRSGLLGVLWGQEMLEWAAGVAARVQVVRLRRPAHGWTLDEVADMAAAAGKTTTGAV